MSEKGWKDRKWFGRINEKTGKSEEVSWKQLSFRQKNELFRHLFLAGLLPVAAINAGSASIRLHEHRQSQLKQEVQRKNELVFLKHENNEPVVYFKVKEKDGKEIVKKVTLPKNIVNLMQDSDQVSGSTSGGGETITHPSAPAVSESPVYRATEQKKKKTK